MTSSSWNPPSTAQVGGPIDLGVEFCSPADTGTEHIVEVDGTPVITEAVADFAGQVCLDRGVGSFRSTSDRDAFNSDPSIEASNGNLVFTRPGTYTLSFNDYYLYDSQTITVEEQPPNFTVSGCSISPQTVVEGETATVTATISNGGGDGQANVTFSDGGGTVASTQRSVEGGSTATVSVGISYDTPGEYGISIDVS